VDKAPDAFRTISEVAEEINVPQHVLRFWESRFTQIKPMKRGGGRRYYRPDDVDLLRGVRHLLYGEGYTIRGVQRILREEGVSFVQSVWRAGSAPPPPAEDKEADRADARAAAERGEAPNFFGLLRGEEADRSEALRRGEPAIVPAAAAAGAGILDARRHRLQSALDDLIACRRMIDAALTADYADDDRGPDRETATAP